MWSLELTGVLQIHSLKFLTLDLAVHCKNWLQKLGGVMPPIFKWLKSCPPIISQQACLMNIHKQIQTGMHDLEIFATHELLPDINLHVDKNYHNLTLTFSLGEAILVFCLQKILTEKQ